MLGPGVKLSDRYRLDERVATGGMGEVWRATDTLLGRTVAVKVLLPALLTDPAFTARFRAEARIMAALHHPGIVDVYDCGDDAPPGGGHALYLVMEYVTGESLSQRLATVGQLSVAETMSIVAQAAEALQVAHTSRIVHRDVKPGNLLVRPDGTVMLVDFGVARSAAATGLTTANAVVGTALYMAPEQAQSRPVSAATDIYALGAVAYHCLTGRPPFTGDNPLHVAVKHVQEEPPPLPAEIPPAVAALVGRALAKEPSGRYPTAAAFAAAARGAVAASGASTSATAPVSPAPAAAAAVPGVPAGPDTLTDMPAAPAATAGPTRRRRRRAALAGVAAAVLLALAGLTAVLGFAPETGTPTGPARTSAPTASATPRIHQPNDAEPPSPGRTGGPRRTTPAATRPAGAPSASAGSRTSTGPTPPSTRTPATPAPTRSATTNPASPQASP